MAGAVLPSQCPRDLLDITGAEQKQRMAEGDARSDELAECWSAEGSWECKWGCKDQQASLSADFTCLFNQRPRQEASPHNCAVPMATPLLIMAHPLTESFEQRGEVDTCECWTRERRRGESVCFSLRSLEPTQDYWDLVEFLKSFIEFKVGKWRVLLLWKKILPTFLVHFLKCRVLMPFNHYKLTILEF